MSLGIVTAKELPVLVIFVFLPRPQIPFFFAASCILIVVSESVKDSLHSEQISAGNSPKYTPNIVSLIFPFLRVPFSQIGHFILCSPWFYSYNKTIITFLFINNTKIFVMRQNFIWILQFFASSFDTLFDIFFIYSPSNHLLSRMF